MKELKTTLKNASGLHARPAKELVQLAKTFESEITLIKDNHAHNAKSLMKLLQAGFSQGDDITVRGQGSDEERAVQHIIDFINGLNE
ncbi:HPr family phosphocarrier protein [Dichelobacter nodosus]|uniref:Phosphocarrier protein HPr n=1 Tax=Dichelobacter nodosus (strain VCS1703A) TaxID=246195 RepID=A5EWQ7_DICNV|nr:HPr family phosphocarrier protein [Dichelobacter nodosus]ABQ13412.1 PTS phosphocarrier protein HPr [Dichelobacter nodosus VCS1703A]AXM45048.1 HPr family phosphocarrier protein [Dichelobacter nodosus]KNZ39736.1 PTS sugar transporter subunit IIA [Dichelobacter nodosus]TGA65895.1 HPr family phosphocarrier protein [Dichelobacter nodosus]